MARFVWVTWVGLGFIHHYKTGETGETVETRATIDGTSKVEGEGVGVGVGVGDREMEDDN